ncbi:beta-ketoacyl-ACP synthase II [Brevibacterium daeguense]|uniref:Beta-ketoacyl-ACP synthase II n=1 Tax=Brevibacterium daeguense TaxID=909936 RepID=A0ABP8EI72_9MICO
MTAGGEGTRAPGQQRRVAITGLGAITPSGLSAAATWETVVAGRSAIDVLEGPEFAELPVRIGGQVRGFDATSVLRPALARRLSPMQCWAIAAADEAMRQAGLLAADPTAERGAASGSPANADPQAPQASLPCEPHRFSIVSATGSGPVDAMQHATRALIEGGPRAVPLTLAIYGAPDAASAILSQRYRATGQAQGIAATCASGAVGLGEALRRIRHGYADAVLVVGLEDCLTPVNLASNANLRSLAAGFEDDPTAASRPFDAGRTGFVMAAGASAILLEAEDVARSRGATPLAELAGSGAASDAHHPTAPHPEGLRAATAVRECLADAGAAPEDVDHINAHGTGTPLGDAAELRALDSALGERARRIPITATKSSTGHLLGAGGVVEAVLAVHTLREGLIPPTLNLDDPEFPDYDVVRGRARQADIATVLSNSFGFGGHNAAVLLRRWE